MKSSSITWSLSFLIAIIPASVQIFLRSAPLKSSLNLATASKSTSPLIAIDLAWIFIISNLDYSFGNGISTFLSNLPGLSKAGSKTSGLLVAITTFTFPKSSNPSN